MAKFPAAPVIRYVGHEVSSQATPRDASQATNGTRVYLPQMPRMPIFPPYGQLLSVPPGFQYRGSSQSLWRGPESAPPPPNAVLLPVYSNPLAPVPFMYGQGAGQVYSQHSEYHPLSRQRPSSASQPPKKHRRKTTTAPRRIPTTIPEIVITPETGDSYPVVSSNQQSAEALNVDPGPGTSELTKDEMDYIEYRKRSNLAGKRHREKRRMEETLVKEQLRQLQVKNQELLHANSALNADNRALRTQLSQAGLDSGSQHYGIASHCVPLVARHTNVAMRLKFKTYILLAVAIFRFSHISVDRNLNLIDNIKTEIKLQRMDIQQLDEEEAKEHQNELCLCSNCIQQTIQGEVKRELDENWRFVVS